MSERPYFIFGLPPFEIELKKQKAYSFHLGMIGLYFGNLGKKFVSFKILARYRKSRISRQDLANLGEM